MQNPAHSWVAAPAAPGAAVATPPTSVSVATAVSTFLLIDSTWVDDELMTDLLSEDLTGCGLVRHQACSSRLPVAPLWTLVAPWRRGRLASRRGHDGHATRVVKHASGHGDALSRRPHLDPSCDRHGASTGTR